MGDFSPSMRITLAAWSSDVNVAQALGIWPGCVNHAMLARGGATVEHKEVNRQGNMLD